MYKRQVIGAAGSAAEQLKKKGIQANEQTWETMSQLNNERLQGIYKEHKFNDTKGALAAIALAYRGANSYQIPISGSEEKDDARRRIDHIRKMIEMEDASVFDEIREGIGKLQRLI